MLSSSVVRHLLSLSYVALLTFWLSKHWRELAWWLKKTWLVAYLVPLALLTFFLVMYMFVSHLTDITPSRVCGLRLLYHGCWRRVSCSSGDWRRPSLRNRWLISGISGRKEFAQGRRMASWDTWIRRRQRKKSVFIVAIRCRAGFIPYIDSVTGLLADRLWARMTTYSYISTLEPKHINEITEYTCNRWLYLYGA